MVNKSLLLYKEQIENRHRWYKDVIDKSNNNEIKVGSLYDIDELVIGELYTMVYCTVLIIGNHVSVYDKLPLFRIVPEEHELPYVNIKPVKEDYNNNALLYCGEVELKLYDKDKFTKLNKFLVNKEMLYVYGDILTGDLEVRYPNRVFYVSAKNIGRYNI